MKKEARPQDILNKLYCSDNALENAKQLLSAPDQSEEGFLGAQGVLMLQGLL